MLNRRGPTHVDFNLPSHTVPGRKPRLPLLMKRSSPRRIVNLAFFICALLLILYLNRTSFDPTPFAWTTVHYQTTSRTLPEARGICPGLTSNTKPALIVARISSDDKSWLSSPELVEKYQICAYTADAPYDSTSSHLQVPANRGHEAMTYLTFIIDNFDSLPDASIFIHGSRFAWHNDHPKYDNLALLQTLNVSSALAAHGYHNLKCDWSASTCPKEAEAQGSLQKSVRKVLEPFNANVISDAALPGALVAIFGTGKKDVRVRLSRSDTVKSQCCAQFVVSRSNILQHSREEYIALRQWLLDGRIKDPVLQSEIPQNPNTDAAHPDDKVAGRVVSYLWHILFMPHTQNVDQEDGGVDLATLNRMACPSAEECYCKLYGRCELKGCSENRCRGQYQVPTGFRLPEGWAERYS